MADQPAGDLAASAPPAAPRPSKSGGGARLLAFRQVEDVFRLCGYLLLTLVGVAMATFADETMVGIDEDLVAGFQLVPRGIALLAVAIVQLLVLLLQIGAPVALAIARRWRTLVLGVAALVVAGILFALIERVLPERTPPAPADPDAFLFDQAWPPTGALASFAAVVVVVSPELSKRWGRALWVLIGVLALLRIATAADYPLDVVLALGVGGSVGSLLLLVFGRPVRTVAPEDVARALTAAGVAVTDVAAREDGGRSGRFRATRADGAVLAVKVVGRQDWLVDRLRRAYRRIRLQNVGDDTGYSSPMRAVAAEALLDYHARAGGARTPAVRAIAPMGPDDALLAVDHVEGHSLAGVLDADLTDAVLQDAWSQVAGLRAGLVAHRNLRMDSLLLDGKGRVWVTGLGFGNPGAERQVLAGDVAELLASMAARVGAERTVAAAVAVIGTDALAESVPRLVPAAWSRPTRAAISKQDEGRDRLVDEVSRVTDVSRPEFADVERIKPRFVLTGVALGVAFYVLLPQLADAPRMIEAVREANVAWFAVALAASLMTYVGAGAALAGGAPGRVPVTLAGLVAVAGSFVATVAPPGVGNIGLNVRFLQKRGLPVPLAVSATAAKEAAVLIVHLTLLVIVAVWAGRSGAVGDLLDHLPSWEWLVAGAGALIALIAVSLGLPRIRSWLRGTVLPSVRSSAKAMREVASRPGKLALLFTGAALLPLGYAGALYASVQAFDGQVGFASVALVFLTAGAVASAAPTPGGIGAVEAVLLAALTAIGMPSTEALAAVFLYRVATFWLPIAPGFLCFRWLTTRGVL